MLEVVLGGPIKALFGPVGFDKAWETRIRKTAATFAEHGMVMRSAHLMESFKRLPPGDVNGVAFRDHNLVTAADVYIATLPLNQHGDLIPSVGTGVEIG